jgi:hypothetical protein
LDSEFLTLAALAGLQALGSFDRADHLPTEVFLGSDGNFRSDRATVPDYCGGTATELHRVP